jgi:hypothetical protein
MMQDIVSRAQGLQSAPRPGDNLSSDLRKGRRMRSIPLLVLAMVPLPFCAAARVEVAK